MPLAPVDARSPGLTDSTGQAGHTALAAAVPASA